MSRKVNDEVRLSICGSSAFEDPVVSPTITRGKSHPINELLDPEAKPQHRPHSRDSSEPAQLRFRRVGAGSPQSASRSEPVNALSGVQMPQSPSAPSYAQLQLQSEHSMVYFGSTEMPSVLEHSCSEQEGNNLTIDASQHAVVGEDETARASDSLGGGHQGLTWRGRLKRAALSPDFVTIMFITIPPMLSFAIIGGLTATLALI